MLDGEHGLSLCHHVYPGNVAEVEEFSTSLVRITRLLDQNLREFGKDTPVAGFVRIRQSGLLGG